MNDKNKSLSFLIQSVLSISAIIFLVISAFERDFINVTEILIALTLFVMAFNNYKIYKKKYFTIIYSLFGTFLLISTLIGILK